MRFEERELRSYAQPVTNGLIEGEVYFSVQYVDEDLLIPIIETLVFVGALDANDPNLLYFQDVGSYRQGIRHDSANAEEAEFQVGSRGGINHIFEYERALDELMKCSLRRRKKLKEL